MYDKFKFIDVNYIFFFQRESNILKIVLQKLVNNNNEDKLNVNDIIKKIKNNDIYYSKVNIKKINLFLFLKEIYNEIQEIKNDFFKEIEIKGKNKKIHLFSHFNLKMKK